MSESTRSVSTSSISTTGLLGILFVGLKLTGFIDWPWIWVLAPFWVPLAILLSILVVCGLIVLATYIIDSASK